MKPDGGQHTAVRQVLVLCCRHSPLTAGEHYFGKSYQRKRAGGYSREWSHTTDQGDGARTQSSVYTLLVAHHAGNVSSHSVINRSMKLLWPVLLWVATTVSLVDVTDVSEDEGD